MQTIAVVFGIGFATYEYIIGKRLRENEGAENTIKIAKELEGLRNKELDRLLDQVLPKLSDTANAEETRAHVEWWVENGKELRDLFNTIIIQNRHKIIKELKAKEPIYYKALSCLNTGQCSEKAFVRYICNSVRRDWRRYNVHITNLRKTLRASVPEGKGVFSLSEITPDYAFSLTALQRGICDLPGFNEVLQVP